MKHGIKLRKLGRTSSHRQALLRNLVSALLHHEQIKTTVPKAKEAARLVEKMITLGKKNTDSARRSAQAFLMPAHHYGESVVPLPRQPISPFAYSSSSASVSASSSSPSLLDAPDLISDESSVSLSYPQTTSLLPKVFNTLASRYSSRPGGYTRILKFGRRPGDNAPVCILSLVDGPRDIKAEMAARVLGRHAVEWGVGREEKNAAIAEIIQLARNPNEGEDVGRSAEENDRWRNMNEASRESIVKVLKFKSDVEVREFEEKARHYSALAEVSSAVSRVDSPSRYTAPLSAQPNRPESLTRSGPVSFAGHRLAPPTSAVPETAAAAASVGLSRNSSLALARGVLGKSPLSFGKGKKQHARSLQGVDN